MFLHFTQTHTWETDNFRVVSYFFKSCALFRLGSGFPEGRSLCLCVYCVIVDSLGRCVSSLKNLFFMLVNWWLEWCEGGCGGGGSLSLPLSSSSAALRSRIPVAPTSRITSLMEVGWRKRRQRDVRELTFHTATPSTCRYGHMESYLIPIDLSPDCNLLILISLISLACLLKLRFHINYPKLSTQDGFMLNSIRLLMKMSF